MTIHILVGRGSNCSCDDCSVLYTGNPKDCWTTKDNNLLDDIEENLEAYFGLTKRGIPRKVSDYTIDKAIEMFFAERIIKRAKITSAQFYRKYYACLPLLFVMLSKAKPEGLSLYKKWRFYMFRDLIKEMKNEK